MFRNINARALELLPPFIAEDVSQEDIQKVAFRLNNDPGAPATLQIRVQFTGTDQSLMEKWASLSKPKEEKKTLHCFGPCGQSVSATRMHHFGYCEHNVCPQCLARAPRNAYFPDVPACPNIDCVDHNVDDAVTDVSLDTDDLFATSRSTSTNNAKELINCKLVLLEKKGVKKTKESLAEEWYHTTSLQEVRRRIDSYRPQQLTSLNYCPGSFYSSEMMQPLPEGGRLVDLVAPTDDTQVVFIAGFGGAKL